MKNRFSRTANVPDSADLEEACLTLKWNYRKRPANPQFRGEIAAELRELRATIFGSVPEAQRREALKEVHQLHRRCSEKMQEYFEAETTLRRIHERMLADFCLWRFCGWKFEKRGGIVRFVSPNGT